MLQVTTKHTEFHYLVVETSRSPNNYDYIKIRYII